MPDSTSQFDTLAIIGVGLIGSSLAAAAKAHSLASRIVLFDVNPSVRARVVELGLGEVADILVPTCSTQDLIDEGLLAPIRYYAPSEPDLTGVHPGVAMLFNPALNTYFVSLFSHDPAVELARYPGPVLVVQGDFFLGH
jgi:hypothetical protein